MRVVRVPVALTLLCVALLAFAACGSDDDGESSADAANGETCPSAPAAISDTMLPSDFPSVDDVVFTSTQLQGPSTIVEGYADKALGDLFDAYKEALGEAPYSVTKSEQEEHDAEVNYASAEGSGQVRLGEECRGRTSVRVVFRPI